MFENAVSRTGAPGSTGKKGRQAFRAQSTIGEPTSGPSSDVALVTPGYPGAPVIGNGLQRGLCAAQPRKDGRRDEPRDTSQAVFASGARRSGDRDPGAAAYPDQGLCGFLL